MRFSKGKTKFLCNRIDSDTSSIGLSRLSPGNKNKSKKNFSATSIEFDREFKIGDKFNQKKQSISVQFETSLENLAKSTIRLYVVEYDPATEETSESQSPELKQNFFPETDFNALLKVNPKQRTQS